MAANQIPVGGAASVPATPTTSALNNSTHGAASGSSTGVASEIFKKFFPNLSENQLNCLVDQYAGRLNSSSPGVRQEAMRELQQWAAKRGLSDDDVSDAIAALDKRASLAPSDPANRDHDGYCAANPPSGGIQLKPPIHLPVRPLGPIIGGGALQWGQSGARQLGQAHKRQMIDND